MNDGIGVVVDKVDGKSTFLPLQVLEGKSFSVLCGTSLE